MAEPSKHICDLKLTYRLLICLFISFDFPQLHIREVGGRSLIYLSLLWCFFFGKCGFGSHTILRPGLVVALGICTLQGGGRTALLSWGSASSLPQELLTGACSQCCPPEASPPTDLGTQEKRSDSQATTFSAVRYKH